MDKYAAFCINTDSPEMHCDGYCQLALKMEDNGIHHHGDSTLQEETPNLYIYLPTKSFHLSAATIFPNFENSYPPDAQFKAKESSYSLFRPPRFV